VIKKFKTPSLKTRFFWKLTNSTLSGGLSFLMLPFVSRALGPTDYGLYNFLRFFFEKIIQFFDIGASAFYPRFSRNPGDRGILRFLILYDFILLIGSILALLTLFISGKAESVLTTKSFFIISLTFIFMWLFIVNGKMTELMDALGRTITNEIVQFFMRLALAIGIGLLFLSNKLSIGTYLAIQSLVYFIFVVFLISLAKKYLPPKTQTTPLKETANDFRVYSQPLFLASLVGIITGLGDRWILQVFSGAAEQGYYSFGLNLGTICFLLTGSVTPLLIREYAIAHSKNDKARIAAMFSKFLPVFYMLTAMISCFLATHGDWISPILGGADFTKAAIPVMLLTLGPIHQTYGQLSGGLMVATDRTKNYGKINMFMALIGLPVTYLCVAPKSYLGLDLGAAGLAFKTVFLQIVMVNIQIWYNTKYLGLKMTKFVIQQVVILGLLLAIGFMSKYIIGFFGSPGIITLLFSGMIYMTCIAVVIFSFPGIISISREEMMEYIGKQLKVFRQQA